MLLDLHVRNLAVVASASVELGQGLNALTGETGAGKSIVVDSLALLAGARASSELIRTGAETLTVTGVFQPGGTGWRAVLEEAGVEADGPEVLVRREVSHTGRNRVYVNDQPTTLRLLAELGPSLLRIHGQREELGLTAPDLQRQWLDRSGGLEAAELTAAVERRYEAYADLARRLERLTGDERARRERLDLLRFQAREIDAVEPEEGEEEGLREERGLLRHREAVTRSLGGASALLLDEEGAAAELAARARDLLEEVEEWEPRATAWRAEAEEVRIRLQELAGEVRGRLEEIESDPDRLNTVEERLAELERLFRKYGASSTEVLERRRAVAAELDELEVDEAGREELEGKVAAAVNEYRQAAVALSQARERWGEALARRVEAELADLGMKQARLAVRLSRRRRSGSPLVVEGEAVELSPEGIDHVVFELAANPGEEPRPLARIASGGELSRIYLALQVAVAGEAEAGAPTLVFDEVDSGVGGAAAAALGKKLQRLAGGGQVLSVTHLPQVASCADHHFRVAKEVRGGRTHTLVESLDEEERVEEVSRMLAGEEVTDLSRSHARELLAGSRRTA